MSRSATYNDWMEKLLESYSKEELAFQKRKILNATKDNRDFKLLKNVLGKEAPSDLNDFQKIKYENKAEYNKLKRKYQQKKKAKV